MNRQTRDNSTAAMGFVFIMGILMGMLIAAAVIDDRESFTIPGTDKTFVRASTESGEQP
jgi:hypothetical protein